MSKESQQKLLSTIAVLSSFNENQSSDDMQRNLEEINNCILQLLNVDPKDTWRALDDLSGEMSSYSWGRHDELFIDGEDGNLIEVDADQYTVYNLGGW